MTYGQRLCANLAIALESASAEPESAEGLAAKYGEAALRDGLLRLREFVRELYADMGQRPSAYGIPDAPETVAHDARKRREVRKPIEDAVTLLYSAGLLGQLRARGGSLDLEVAEGRLLARCDELGIAAAGRLLKAFAKLGLRTTRAADGVLVARGRHCGRLPLALKLFAEACRLYVTKRRRKQKDERQPPNVFYRVDLRIMRRSGRKVRLPKLTVDDVAPYLGRRQARGLRELSDHVEGLGYRARIKCVDAIGPSFRSAYINPANHRTLFGFGFDHAGLSLRLSLGDTRRMLPHIEQCPRRLRDEILRGRCARCGGNGCGKQVTVSVNGEERDICHYGILGIREWRAKDIPAIKWLLAVGAGFFEKEGRRKA